MSADALREYARVKPILTEEDLVRLEDARLVQDYQPKFALSRKIIRAWEGEETHRRDSLRAQAGREVPPTPSRSWRKSTAPSGSARRRLGTSP